MVAADGGAGHALALGLHVDAVVGDFDSVEAAVLAQLESGGTRIERHPVDKDASDLELALEAALELGPSRILVVGGIEGRLDHLIAELLVLGLPAWAQVELDAIFGAARLHVVRRQRTLSGRPDELISLFALGGPAEGVMTEGLVYPLRKETLQPGSTRGLSNRFTADEARVAVDRGVLLAVRP